MQNPTFELIAIRIRRWSLVIESAAALYSVRTPTTSLIPKSGTAMPERSMLNFVGSFRYPGSTEGLPLMIGLPLDATQPESPCPMGIAGDVLRIQLVILSNIHSDGVVGHQLLQA